MRTVRRLNRSPGTIAFVHYREPFPPALQSPSNAIAATIDPQPGHHVNRDYPRVRRPPDRERLWDRAAEIAAEEGIEDGGFAGLHLAHDDEEEWIAEAVV